MILAACCLSSVSLFTSCDDYDDTELWNKVNGLEERIAALEEWQKTTDNNLNALQTLINTMDYITSVAPIMQANDTIGYTINFHQSNPISIYNGTTSQIGITQDEEGNWLWTLDGEILTTPDGTPIPANGQDAAAPQLSTGKALQDEGIKTDAEGDAIIADIAYLSVDEGETWYRVTGEKGEQGDKGNTGSTGATGPAGANGDSFFEDVEIVGNNVVFTLADGKTFTVAKYNGALTFMQNGKALDLTTTIDLADGALTYAPSDAEVSARIIDGEGWSASAASGTITIKGIVGSNALLEVTLTDNGRVIETYRLTLTQSTLAGSGTAEDPYTVSSAAELAYIAEQVNNGTTYDQKYIQLTQDIDLTGVEWNPIGYTLSGSVALGKPFLGIFDGNGKTISNLYVATEEENLMVGFIGHNRGTVKNLTIENATVKGKNSVGVIVGDNEGVIENCHVSGTVHVSTSGDDCLGGLVGYNSIQNAGVATIRECSASGVEVTSETANQVGGLVGQNSGGIIEASYFSGKVTGKTTGTVTMGGIVGYTSAGTIKACYSICELLSGLTNSCFTGGIAGNAYNDNIEACYALIKNCSNMYASGILGRSNPCDITSCYWKTEGTYPTKGTGWTSAGDSESNAVKVDGTTTWSAALTAMNTALNGTGWEYVENTDPDTKASIPLTLKEQ